MSRKKILAGVLLALGLIVVSYFYLRRLNFAVLQPAGVIGEKERNLIYIALGLSVIVVVPVFIMLFLFSWKYREGNTKAKYQPDFINSRKLEAFWWGIPFAIILILSVITWNSSHDLDPFRPLQAYAKPLNVQVVALQWRWLFIYPDYGMATVNYLQIPTKTPVNFEITSDAPMNSFWIPQLGGQIYAMPGMTTHLNLMASKAGDYTGKSANISGTGFAGMTFTTRASSQKNFKSWIKQLGAANNTLTQDSYDQLAKPSEDHRVVYFSSVDNKLYHRTVMKYKEPSNTPTEIHDGMGM
jgi:cytochrome o ubiquinol oxidase subunit 2